MCDNNKNPFITTSHNVLLELDLCDSLNIYVNEIGTS